MFGIGMVSTQDAENAGLSVKAAFSPCANLKLLSEILAQHHEKASGEGTAQWLKASAMNGTGTGEGEGEGEGEVAQAYIADIENIRVRFDGLLENPATQNTTQNTVSEIAKEAIGQQPQATKTASPGWDVFGENSGHSVLIYQGKITQ